MSRLKRWSRRAGLGLLGLFAVIGGLVACNSLPTTLTEKPAQSLRLASYNVHYIIAFRETGKWSVGDWNRRKGPMQSAIRAIDADLMAFQEMESFRRGNSSAENLTLTWLLDQNPDYAAAAVGNPTEFPSTQPILYRKARLEMRDQGWFFFSDTPDVIYSRTFNGSFPAFTSWATFADKTTGEVFTVFNLHTDFRSRDNRQRSAALVAARIKPRINAGETVLIAGDFNARKGAATLNIIEEAGITFWPVQGSTYHMNAGINLFGAIDHLGGTANTSPVSRPIAVRQKFDGEWPTDHYPIVGDIQINP